MRNELDKIHMLDRARLSEEDYFQSLLEQARDKEILNDGDLERLQFECLQLLAYKTERYNAGDSSSIPVEKAQSIMTSILFTVGVFLKTFPNPDDAIVALRNEPVEVLYKKGRKRIDAMLLPAKALHAKLLRQLVETPNVYYRSTIEDGISGFFKLYDPDFAAQEIHITADYPLFNPIPRLMGIEFITAYIEAAYYENQFCRHFDANDIHRLLCGYEKGYEELLVNIYEIVLTTAVGCRTAGTDVSQLVITESGIEYLERLFSKFSASETLTAIQKAITGLAHHFQCPGSLVKYLTKSAPLLAEKIKAAAEEHTLGRIFFLPAFPGNNPRTVFSYGEKMDDEPYRKMIGEINECRFSRDKIALIKERVHSLADLEDALIDAEISAEEIQAVLGGLELPEIAALLKRHPFQPPMDISELRERERILRKSLHDFIGQLPPGQQEIIIKASAAIFENE